jgi:hypothetical protein
MSLLAALIVKRSEKVAAILARWNTLMTGSRL